VKAGRAARLALLLAGAAVLLAAVALAPGRRPDSTGQRELHLAVESLATDGDLAFDEADAERYRKEFGAGALQGFRLRVGAGRDRERPGPPRARERDAGPRLRAPWLWVQAAAAARRAGGREAVFALQGLWVLAGVALLAWAAKPRLGSSGAPLVVGLAIFATAAGFSSLFLAPETLLFFCMASASALTWGRRAGPDAEPAQVFAGELTERAGAWRWPLAGAAFGLVATGGAPYLALGAPLLAAASEGRRAGRAALLAGGGALGFGAVTLAGGWPWPPLELWHDPKLLGWAAVGLAVGRHSGLLGWYAAALVAFVAAARGQGRRWIPWSLAAAAAVQVATSPFDLGGDSGAPGAPWFLPALALLAFLPAHPPGRGVALALGLVSLLLVAPGWWAALGLEGRAWARESARVRALLPLDTTLRELPGAVTLERSGIALSGFAPEVFAGGDGRLRLLGRNAELMVESAAPLESIRLELGASAPADLAIRGATAGDLVLRPDGEVALDVVLGTPARRHPTWRSPRGASIYSFSIELPRAPAAPMALDFSLARPALGAEAP
jgi:hypothetical protein